MKLGNLMVQKIVRIETEQVNKCIHGYWGEGQSGGPEKVRIETKQIKLTGERGGIMVVQKIVY